MNDKTGYLQLLGEPKRGGEFQVALKIGRQEDGVMDMQQYVKNRHQFRHEELERHAGRYVAWSPDGTQIIASDEDPGQVVDAVKLLGFDPGETLISYIPPLDATLLAGQAGGVPEA
jgi:hypothetical protein